MEILIEVNIKQINLTVMVIIIGLEEINILDSLLMDQEMEMDNGLVKMDKNLKDSIEMIGEMDMEFINGQTAIFMKENSKMI